MAPTDPRHDQACHDDEGVLDGCVCGLDDHTPTDTYDPDDHEPMGGDPYWAEENDR